MLLATYRCSALSVARPSLCLPHPDGTPLNQTRYLGIFEIARRRGYHSWKMETDMAAVACLLFGAASALQTRAQAIEELGCLACHYNF